ncbi:MAG: hypothetical protein A2527_00040 [Candidatus Lambdaproteobacteria bacterium RIFOXYD2_FULL_50_16]|uniref:AI-2E family transporter n=1 Tax=Candidatus Lambdaproteobacteria bacterium RIFOXYD2_FULL_50_16 TaxID=1817772 RepID=A0A1F6GFM8_9PROT|nr:MAG: hypothetical protein A2527_00040 [Candidatus Lambdaproteobacteria bacterium RIFOXYD2_FULL_50_16]
MVSPLTDREKRRMWVLSVSGVLFLLTTLALVWALRALILPSIVGALGAYLCKPLLNRMKHRGVSNSLAIVILFAAFFLIIMLLSKQIQSIIPDNAGKLELRVRIQYRLNQKFSQILGIEDGGKGNMVYNMLGRDLLPMMDKVNSAIMLERDERKQFIRSYRLRFDDSFLEQKYFQYFLANVNADKERMGSRYGQPVDLDAASNLEGDPSGANAKPATSTLTKIGNLISIWLAAPFVFLFLLLDEGEIKKNLVYLVPNRYFEMVLTVLDNVDDAIGKYLRGTMLECSLVGFTFFVCLWVVGFELKWALLIGLVAGISNAIPFVGPAIGLVVGMSYALVVENYEPLLPFIDPNSMILWVTISVLIAQGLDNAVFQPIVLGSAVSLHPLVVIIGVMGGSILLGLPGMLFAIPTIVVVKVVVGTLFSEMKSYRII